MPRILLSPVFAESAGLRVFHGSEWRHSQPLEGTVLEVVDRATA
jgi:hypothetical protein